MDFGLCFGGIERLIRGENRVIPSKFLDFEPFFMKNSHLAPDG